MVQSGHAEDESANVLATALDTLLKVVKGQAEQNMLDFVTTEGTKGLWETLIVKPGFVISKDIRSPRDIMGWMMGMKACI